MLVYFPSVYPDELLYSVLGRYQRHMRLPPLTQTNLDLLGRRLAISSLDHPSGIKYLATMHPDPAMTPERILDEMTLFNYFTAFVSPRFANAMRDQVLGGHVRDWYLKSGYPAFKVARIRVLRFCQSCKTSMLKAHGELYWKRSHQLPSVLVCPEHQEVLCESLVDLKARGRHAFTGADLTNCPETARTVMPESMLNTIVFQRMHGLALLSLEALAPDFKRRTLGGWTTYYRRLLEESGFAIGNSSINLTRLSQSFTAFYSDPVQWVPGIDIDPLMPWLTKLARKQRSHSHPLQHLLLQHFLKADQTKGEPFGHGPWKCMNPLADHYDRKVIRRYETHSNHDHKVAVFKCACGYVYTRWFYPDSCQTGQPRFQSFGAMLEPALQTLINEGHSLRSIARKLQIDPKTVVRLGSELKIAILWKTGIYLKRPVATKLIKNEVKPAIKRVKKVCLTKLDWKSIDRELRHRSQLCVRELRGINPPIRVTISEVERRIKQVGWISKRLHKLPHTKKYLDRSLESNDSFRKRRIEWAIDELLSTGHPLGRSNVIRKACIRSDAVPLVDKMLQRSNDMRELNV